VSAIQLGLEIVQWIIVVVLVILVAGFVDKTAEFHRRLGPDPSALLTSRALAVGALVPEVRTRDVRSGDQIVLPERGVTRRIVVFLSPSCSACVDAIPQLNALQAKASEPIVVVTRDAPQAQFGERLDRRIALIDDPDNAVERQFRVPVTPYVYLIDDAGIVQLSAVLSDSVVAQLGVDGRRRTRA
jgi:thiol-disulfide isomerase/thioredoxin